MIVVDRLHKPDTVGVEKDSLGVGLGGCRLADGKLHFGHLNGCLSSPRLSDLSKYFFVVQDTIVDRSTSETYLTRLYRLVASVLALMPIGPRTIIVRQSSIQEHYTRLFGALTELSPTTLIVQKNPKIQGGHFQGTHLDQFIFPLGEVCNMFALGCDYVFMNDDNLRFVNLARKLRRKMNSAGFAYAPPRPELILGGSPRVYGYNYMKMSKGNRNVISLGSSPSELGAQIERLVNRTWLYKQGSKYRKALAQNDITVTHPDDFPLFSFYQAFVDPNAQVGSVVLGMEDYLPRVLKATTAHNDRVLEFLSSKTNSESNILERVVSDEVLASKIIRENLEGLY